MELWIDSADVQFIKTIADMGLCYGVTTNPSIIARTKEMPLSIIEKILTAQSGPVAVQVTALTPQQMVEQARALRNLSSRIIVKIPIIQAGLTALTRLKDENIPILATAIVNSNQLLLSMIHQPQYSACYYGAIKHSVKKSINYLKEMLEIIRQQSFSTKLMAAAIRNVEQVKICASLGVSAVTLPPQVFNDLLRSPSLTDYYVNRFNSDWKKQFDHSFLIS